MGHFYYDEEGITFLSNDIARVWERKVGRTEMKRETKDFLAINWEGAERDDIYY
jgi:hypothetical protein